MIEPNQVTLVELDDATLVATAFDAADREVTGLSVIWRSSDPEIASVSAMGVVTGSGVGSATITVTIEGVDAQAEVTVTPGVVAGVTVAGVPSRTWVGEVVPLVALAVDSQDRALIGRAVTWTSSVPSVASIDSFGSLTTHAPGAATVTAVVEGIQGHAEVDVAPLVRHRLALGKHHTCHLDDAGAAWCWGSNSDGQLGDGTYTDSDVPTAAAPGLTFIALSAGEVSTCGITDQDEAWCWGSDANWQLGAVGSSPTPVLVGQGPFDSTSSQYYNSCGIDLQRHAWCWGYNSSDYELGNASEDSSPVPVAVSGPAGGAPLELVDVKGGLWHACGLTVDARLFCWGYNWYGQLGLGHFGSVAGPVEVFPGQRVDAFGVGEFMACATADGTSYCWGESSFGKLGIGSAPGFKVADPTPVLSNGISFTDFSGGWEHMCGLDPTGAAWCWGTNDEGQLGNPGFGVDTPAAVAGGHVFTTIEARSYHTCGIADTGALYCWGRNADGRLGVGLPVAFLKVPTEVQR